LRSRAANSRSTWPGAVRVALAVTVVPSRVVTGGVVTRSLAVDARDRKGYSAIYRPIADGLDSGKAAVGCPTAAGSVQADESFAVGGTLIIGKGKRVLESATSRATITVHARGQVGADARLHRVEGDVTFTFGTYRRGHQEEVTVRLALTAGRTGAAAVTGTPSATARLRTVRTSAAEERAGERALAREVARNRGILNPLAGMLATARDRLLEAEPSWYDVPNRCARLVFDPAPGTRLDPEATLPVQAQIVSAAGEPAAAGEVTIVRVGRGHFQPARTASAPGAPAQFTATGVEPDRWKQTVAVDLIATSTAGRVEHGWLAEGERAAFPWRLHGPVTSTQTAVGWKATFAGTVTYDLQEVSSPDPHGAVTARYDMTAYELPSVFNHKGDGCGFEGTGGGRGWTAGALELTRSADGTVTYTLLVDVQVDGVTMRWVGCERPQPDFPGALQAHLDAAPRRAEPGFRLRAAGATDATSPNADAVTASWDLTPCPEPVAGPVTAGCSG
jgi:hypothetical protein